MGEHSTVWERILRRQYDKLPAGDLLRLREGLETVCEALDGRGFSIGTACSGTDLIMHAAQELNACWEGMFALDAKPFQKFACEIIDFKRRFIELHLRPAHLFADIHLLAGSSVQDHLTGKDVMDLSVVLYACGIECDSISGLNADRCRNFDCAKQDDRETKTGSTARSAMEFVAERRPPAFAFENVKNLGVAGKSGSSNLQYLVRRANSLGYRVVYLVVDCLLFGVPQHRERFYLFGVKVSHEAVADQCVKDFKQPQWALDFLAFVRSMSITPEPLAAFLHEDPNHPDIQEANSVNDEDAKKKVKKRPKSKSRAKKTDADEAEPEQKPDPPQSHEYEVDHLSTYKQSGLKWPPTYTEQFIAKTAGLRERSKQILFHEEQTRGSTATLAGIECRDMNMTMAWGKTKIDRLPCVVSSSRMWARGVLPAGETVDRLLTGSELLHVQGFDLSAQSKEAPGQFSHNEKTDLAGNAFNKAALYAVLTAAMACAPLARAISLGASEVGVAQALVQLDDGQQSATDEVDEGGESESDVGVSAPSASSGVAADLDAELFDSQDLSFT